MEQLLATLGALSLLGQQAANQLFGAYLKGFKMQVAAWLTTIALAFLINWLNPPGVDFADWNVTQTAITGALAGLGSNVVHVILARIAPGSKKFSLSQVLMDVLNTVKNAGAPGAPPATPPSSTIPPVPKP